MSPLRIVRVCLLLVFSKAVEARRRKQDTAANKQVVEDPMFVLPIGEIIHLDKKPSFQNLRAIMERTEFNKGASYVSTQVQRKAFSEGDRDSLKPPRKLTSTHSPRTAGTSVALSMSKAMSPSKAVGTTTSSCNICPEQNVVFNVVVTVNGAEVEVGTGGAPSDSPGGGPSPGAPTRSPVQGMMPTRSPVQGVPTPGVPTRSPVQGVPTPGVPTKSPVQGVPTPGVPTKSPVQGVPTPGNTTNPAGAPTDIPTGRPSYSPATTQEDVNDRFLFFYERAPLSNGGGWTTGRAVPEPINLNRCHKFGVTVKQVRGWYTSPHIKNVYVKYFDDTDCWLNPDVLPSGSPNAEITFAPGETLKGAATLTGSGTDSGLRYIFFETSGGQKFELGEKQTPYTYDTQNAYLTGFARFPAPEDATIIGNLGFYVMKDLKHTQLNSVIYKIEGAGSLSEQAKRSSLEKTVLNQSKSPQKSIFKYIKSVTTTKTWSVSKTGTFKADMEISAGIPEIADFKFKYEISISKTTTNINEVKVTEQKEFSDEVVTDPCTNSKVTITWVEMAGSVSFDATLLHEFVDGTRDLLVIVQGQFDGVTTDTGSIEIIPEPLPPSQCPGKRSLKQVIL